MDYDIPDEDLEDLGYPGNVSGDSAKTILCDGLKSLEFYETVVWLSKELQTLNQMESCINTVDDLEDKSSFLVELNTFLREIECPYDCLTSGPIEEKLMEEKNRAILLDFLCTELMVARILEVKKLKEKRTLDIEMDSSHSATCMSSILNALNIDVDPAGDSSQLVEAIFSQVKEKISRNPEIVDEPLLKDVLSESQWKELEKINSDMRKEYEVRREMLLTRCDVVAQSFKWGENIKGKEEQINVIYQSARKNLKPCPIVELSDILVARKELTLIEKASCASVRKNTVSELNRVMIDRVPDRGGRPNEQRPPTEMPDWKKRTQSQGGGNPRGRGRGGGGGHNKGKFHHRGPKGASQSNDAGVYDAMGSYGNN